MTFRVEALFMTTGTTVGFSRRSPLSDRTELYRIFVVIKAVGGRSMVSCNQPECLKERLKCLLSASNESRVPSATNVPSVPRAPSVPVVPNVPSL